MGIFSFFSVSERTVSALENSRFECCVCGTVINKVCLFNLFTGIPGTFHSCKTGEAFSFLFVWFCTSCQSCLRKERAISWRLLETGAALYIYKSKCMPLCLQLLFMRAESAHKSSQSPASHLYRDSRGGHCRPQDVMLALYFKHVMLPRFCWLSLVCCGTDPPVQNNHQQSTQHGDIALRIPPSQPPCSWIHTIITTSRKLMQGHDCTSWTGSRPRQVQSSVFISLTAFVLWSYHCLPVAAAMSDWSVCSPGQVS